MSVGAADKAGSFHHRGGEQAGFSKKFQSHAGTDDIHDGIDGTDFMKMNILRLLSMHSAFRHGDAVENGDGFLFNPFGEAACKNQLFDGGIIPAMLVIVIIIVVMMAFLVGMTMRMRMSVRVIT